MKETPQSKHFCQSCQEVGKTNLRNRKWRGNFILNQETKHFALSFPFSRKSKKKEISPKGGLLTSLFLPQNLKKWTISIHFLYKLPFQKMCQLRLILSILKKFSCSINVILISSQQNRIAPLKSCLIFYDYETLLTEIYRGSQIKFSLK